MPEPTEFPDLIRRARSGDEAAATELVRQIEPFLQRVVRIRLGPRGQRGPLGCEVGSEDVCQSVFRSFFSGLKANRYDLDRPGGLERLLRVMVRFNVATKARKLCVKLRELVQDFEQGGWIDSARPPDLAVSDQDLVEAIQELFSEDELETLTMGLDGMTWAEVGQKLGQAGDTVRMRMKRAIERVKDRLDGRDRAGA